jgi:6-phosphofructokinase 2
MARIVTLTMNPALDACTSVDKVIPQHKLRCQAVRHDAGGGGINVARVVRRLGGDPLALVPVGGPIGQMLLSELSRETVAHVAIPIPGDTREDWTIDEISSGRQFRFVLPGPRLTDVEIAQCRAAVREHCAGAAFLVASGSLPPGVPATFYRDLATDLAETGLVLDASGNALREGLGVAVHVIKPSLRELEDLIGHPLPDTDSRLAAARQIVRSGGARYVALTLGGEGAMLIGADTALAATPPQVAVRSTVGAGDSFLGAFVWALCEKLAIQDAFRLAVAAGAAALLAPGTELCLAADIATLASQVNLQSLH